MSSVWHTLGIDLCRTSATISEALWTIPSPCRSDDDDIMHSKFLPVKHRSPHSKECRHRERPATRAASEGVLVESIRLVVAFHVQLELTEVVGHYFMETPLTPTDLPGRADLGGLGFYSRWLGAPERGRTGPTGGRAAPSSCAPPAADRLDRRPGRRRRRPSRPWARCWPGRPPRRRCCRRRSRKSQSGRPRRRRRR